jgi:hypothetical protein
VILSDSIFALIEANGDASVYSVQPQHLNDYPGSTLAARVREHGRLIASKTDGRWHRQGQEVTDNRTISLLERTPTA